MNYLKTRETKALYKAILSLKKMDECERFLGDLLTPVEIKEFSNRWRVAQMLDKEISYEEIEQETGMSTTTIARISKWLSGKKGNLGGYQLVLKKMKKNKNAQHTSLT
jgi:TrpR-related protein YerC/YecD